MLVSIAKPTIDEFCGEICVIATILPSEMTELLTDKVGLSPPDETSDNLSTFFLTLAVFDINFSTESLCSAASTLLIFSCFFHLVRLFWNQILTCNNQIMLLKAFR